MQSVFFSGRLKVVACLVGHGAYIIALDKDGCTAVARSKKAKNQEIIDYLLDIAQKQKTHFVKII